MIALKVSFTNKS